MALISFIIPLFTILVYFFGQLLRIDTDLFSFPVIDIFTILLAATNLTSLYFQKKLIITNRYLVWFFIWSAISLTLNFIVSESFSPTSVFYLLRLISLFSFFALPYNNQLFSPRIKKFFNLIIFSNILFGLIQYLFYPDFTAFKSLNWDPHLYRLVSTYFDPTFTALIFLFFLISVFLPKPNYYLLITSYLALALTYSRSSYLSLLAAVSFLAFKFKNFKLVISTFLIILATILLLPRQDGEGTKLERTSSIFAKIENYQQGISLYTKSPLFGTGYNRLPQIRRDVPTDSHAIGGYDSSLLTILITTGPLGLVLFVLSLIKIFNSSNIVLKTCLIALLVHSLFANSLLYPWVILYLVFIRSEPNPISHIPI